MEAGLMKDSLVTATNLIMSPSLLNSRVPHKSEDLFKQSMCEACQKKINNGLAFIFVFELNVA